MTKTPEIKLTDNTLENIQMMAPYLDEACQNQVFGIMLRSIKDIDPKKVTSNKKTS